MNFIYCLQISMFIIAYFVYSERELFHETELERLQKELEVTKGDICFHPIKFSILTKSLSVCKSAIK